MQYLRECVWSTSINTMFFRYILFYNFWWQSYRWGNPKTHRNTLRTLNHFSCLLWTCLITLWISHRKFLRMEMATTKILILPSIHDFSVENYYPLHFVLAQHFHNVASATLWKNFSSSQIFIFPQILQSRAFE